MTGREHTPGPWEWMGNPCGERMCLATTHSGRIFVMGFKRWGMNGAQPMFQVDNRMVPAAELATFEVGDRGVIGLTAAKADPSVYRLDIDGIDHPDARLIAAAPDLLEVAIIDQVLFSVGYTQAAARQLAEQGIDVPPTVQLAQWQRSKRKAAIAKAGATAKDEEFP